MVNSQLDEQLEKAEFSLITSEFEQLAQILEKIDPKTIKDADLRARYYYLKGFEMVFNQAPFTDVLFHFDQLLMSKTTDTVFQLLAYTGIGIAYAREAELEKAEVYFDKVFSEIYTYPIQTTEDIWRVFEYRFPLRGFFYAQTNDLETSNALLNYAIAICSENHLTYYLAPCSCTVGQKMPKLPANQLLSF